MLRCPVCNIDKPHSDFSRKQLDLLWKADRGMCRLCVHKANIERRHVRPDGWVRKTADMPAYQREYRLKNREHVRELESAWKKRKAAEDPNWRYERDRRKYERAQRRKNPDWQPKPVLSAEEKAAAKQARTRRRYRKWKADHPEQYAAKLAVKQAIKMGRLVRQPCAVCGEVKSHGHHPDYAKPLEVVWLCDPHHRAAHRKS